MSKHTFRFLGTPVDQNSQSWSVNKDELQHITKVLKLKTGEVVEVFDGNGSFCKGGITALDKSCCLVKVDSHGTEPPPKNPLTVLMGVLDFRKMDQLIPQLVELGLSELILFSVTEQNQQRANEKTTLRWKKIILEASKQSKRNFMMRLTVEKDLQSAIAPSKIQQTNKLLLDHGGSKHAYELFKSKSGPTVVMLGPEKGLSNSSIEAAIERGFSKASLAPHILRSVTAASVVTAIYNA